MKTRHVLLLIGTPLLMAIFYFAAPSLLDLLSAALLVLVLVCGAGTLGYFIINLINKLDDLIVPEKRLRERTRIVIAVAMSAAIAILQPALASLLLGSTASPLYNAFQAATVQGFNPYWAIWGVATYLIIYFWRESRIH